MNKKTKYKGSSTFHIFTNIGSIANIFIVLFVSLISQPSFSQETIIINSGFSSPISTNTQTGFGDLVLKEAYRRIGHKVETVRMPAERALINANLGIDDGDLLRIDGLEKKYPNLIKVPEKIMDMDVMLFTKNLRSFKVNGWSSVENHSVSIITGWKVFEKNLGEGVKVIKTDNVSQMFTLLLKDRADFVGYERWAGLGHISDNNLDNLTILEPPLVSVPLYTYLHKKHKELVPKLSSAIKNMKRDGTIKALFDERLKPLMK